MNIYKITFLNYTTHQLKTNYTNLPDEVEFELNCEVQDPSLRIEDIVECLKPTGWKNISPKPYVFTNTVNYFDTPSHDIFARGESLRLRSRIEEINGPVRATHKKSMISDSFYAKRHLARASIEHGSDLINGLFSFVLDKGIFHEAPSHMMIEYLKNKNIQIERDGFIFYVTSQSKSFVKPNSHNTHYSKIYEIEINKLSRKASEEDLHLMLEEMHGTIAIKNLPLLVSKDNSYCRGHKLVYSEEELGK